MARRFPLGNILDGAMQRADWGNAPVVGSRRCPVCDRVALQSRQTVCSAACRRRRSRDRQLTALRARDDEVRALLATALKKLEEGAP